MKSHQAESRSCQQNAPLMPVLPDELIVEVLSRLPVKSLLQFRCVCKSWKSLISKPYFVKLHLQRSPKNVNLLLLRNNDEVKNLSIVSVPSLLENPSSPVAEDDCYLLNKNNGYRVVGSCNGLVCLLGVNYTNCFLEYYWFNLWNPSTKIASKDLACLGAGNRWIDMMYRFAFGYDNIGDTYKVVAFCFDSKATEESQKTLVKICSSSDNHWRNIDSFPVVPFDSHFIPGLNDGVYLNGTLNWLALPDNYRWDGTSTSAQLVIVSLDLGTETYTQLLLPRLDEAPSVQPTIGNLMDCLCFSHDWKETHLLIWQMKDFGVEKSWTQFMKVSYQDLQIDYFDLDYPVIPLCMYENGDVMIMTTVAESQAILYHWRENRVERTNFDNDIYWKSIVNYVESLVSPCCN